MESTPNESDAQAAQSQANTRTESETHEAAPAHQPPQKDDEDSIQAKSLAPTISAADANKIEVLFKQVGNAPILKMKKFKMDRTRDVKSVNEWLKKFMKLDPKEQLFFYVNQEFAPSLDTEIGTIFDCFAVEHKLVLHYCTTPAWG